MDKTTARSLAALNLQQPPNLVDAAIGAIEKPVCGAECDVSFQWLP